jgi:hypothetical protein
METNTPDEIRQTAIAQMLHKTTARIMPTVPEKKFIKLFNVYRSNEFVFVWA